MTAGPEQDTPQRPDVTAAQKWAAVIGGVPVVCNLLSAFGIFSPSLAQQHALTATMTWAVVAAGALVLGDSHLRGKRNEAVAAVKVAEAAAAAPVESPGPVGNEHFDPGRWWPTARANLGAAGAAGMPSNRGAGGGGSGGTPSQVTLDNSSGYADYSGIMGDPKPEPDYRDPGEFDDGLADEAIDNPAQLDAAGISRTALADHYMAACSGPEDVDERDARLQRPGGQA